MVETRGSSNCILRGNIQRRLILFQPKRTRDPKSPNVLCLLSVKTVRNQNLFYYISTIVYKISFRRRKNVLLQIKTIQLNFLVFDSMSHSIIMIKVRQILLQYFLMAQTSLQDGVLETSLQIKSLRLLRDRSSHP